MPATVPGVKRHRILAVDDEEVILRLYQAAIGGQYALTTAETAEDALRDLARGSYDAVILDLGLDGPVSGEVLYRRIVEEQPALAARIIFCTGDSSTPETRAFFESVPCRVLWKPFDLNDLRKLVAETVGAWVPRGPRDTVG